MFPVESDDSRGLSHSLWDGMEIFYSLFLLAAFGAIAVVVLCGRQMLKVHEFQSQALFVGGASEAPKPRFVANSEVFDSQISALSVWHEHQGDSQLSWL